MPRGTCLNKTERDVIERMKKDGKTYREIAKVVGRSVNAVHRVINSSKRKMGRPTVTTNADKRHILRCASNSSGSLRQIKEDSGVSVSRSTVRRIILSSPNIKRMKIKRKPPLTQKNKDQRLVFARNHMDWKLEWQKVIFTDEKKFNLDGPDGYNYYYHDLRKEEKVLSRRQCGGGSLMLWGSISCKGALSLERICGRQNANGYLQLLERQIEVIEDEFGTENWIFQQDNAPIHTARTVKNWFASNNVEVLPWPARSPDLNIIENVWGYLSRKVYENGTQYNNINELELAINTHWCMIPLSYIKTLYDSVPQRIFEVIRNNGGSTKY